MIPLIDVSELFRPPGWSDVPSFAPFAYGDHVWAAMMKFVEFQGLDHLRIRDAA
jgi:hypothetical protein